MLQFCMVLHDYDGLPNKELFCIDNWKDIGIILSATEEIYYITVELISMDLSVCWGKWKECEPSHGWWLTYDFCVEFNKQYGSFKKVIPVTTEEYGLYKAIRPIDGKLDKSNFAKNGLTW